MRPDVQGGFWGEGECLGGVIWGSVVRTVYSLFINDTVYTFPEVRAPINDTVYNIHTPAHKEVESAVSVYMGGGAKIDTSFILAVILDRVNFWDPNSYSSFP